MNKILVLVILCFSFFWGRAQGTARIVGVINN